MKQIIRVRLPYEAGEQALERVKAAWRERSGERLPASRPVQEAIVRDCPKTWAELKAWIAQQHRG